MKRKINHDSNEIYRGPLTSPSGSLDADQLLTAIDDLPRQFQSHTKHKTSANTKLLQLHVPIFRGHKDKFKDFE